MDELIRAAEKIREADAVLIGASNGLSIAEGLHLFADNQAFRELFGDYRRKYGITCILQGIGFPWPSQEEKWGFLSRLIWRYCGEYTETGIMSDLKAVVGEKDYFVVTSNGECHFELSGFAPEKIYEVEGNWMTMQCARRCHEKLYPTLDLAKELTAYAENGTIPTEKVPCCPVCGSPMNIHMALDGTFISDRKAAERLERFIEKYHGKKLVILELGIGWRNQLIKAPFMGLAAREPRAAYIAVNRGEIYIPEEIQEKAIGLDGDVTDILKALRQLRWRMRKSRQDVRNMKTIVDVDCPKCHGKDAIEVSKSENRAFQEMRTAAVKRLQGKMGEEVAEKTGALWLERQNRLELESLGQKIQIEYPSWELREELEEWHTLLLLHYLEMADGTPISGEWITLGNLKDGLIRGTGFDHTADMELGKFLRGKDIEDLKKILGTLGARIVDGRADLSAELMLFPRYPLLLNIWMADEEFPAAGKLLVDKSADHYLTIEDAVTAGEVLLRRLKDA